MDSPFFSPAPLIDTSILSDFIPSFMGIEKIRPADDYHWYNGNRDRRCVFQYTIKGFGTYRTRSTEFSVPESAGFLMSMPNDSSHYLGESDFWHFLYISFTGRGAEAFCNSLIRINGPIFKLGKESREEKQLFNIISKVQNKHSAFSLSADIYTFIMSLFDLCNPELYKKATTEETWLQLIRQNYFHSTFGVETLASEAGMSRSYFSKQFKEYTGISPSEYLKSFRISVAKKFLCNSRSTVKKIAAETGFSSESYFCFTFKKMENISPEEFRRLKQKSI